MRTVTIATFHIPRRSTKARCSSRWRPPRGSRLGFEWRTLGGDDAGGQKHHRFDSLTGEETRPSSAMFSLGCHLRADVALTAKDALLGAWRKEAAEAEAEADAAARRARDVSTGPGTSADRNEHTHTETTPAQMSHTSRASPLARWASGDFASKATSRRVFGARRATLETTPEATSLSIPGRSRRVRRVPSLPRPLPPVSRRRRPRRRRLPWRTPQTRPRSSSVPARFVGFDRSLAISRRLPA